MPQAVSLLEGAAFGTLVVVALVVIGGLFAVFLSADQLEE